MKKLTLLFLLISLPAFAGNIYSWPVIDVIDGDTIRVSVPNLPPELKISVRVKDIDTPEKGSRAECLQEALLAIDATEFTKEKVREAQENNTPITFSGISWDKFGGRVLATVMIGNESLARSLIKEKLAREYHGEKKQSWCD